MEGGGFQVFIQKNNLSLFFPFVLSRYSLIKLRNIIDEKILVTSNLEVLCDPFFGRNLVLDM